MIRRKLLVATAIIASVVLTACSDMTAPKNACPVTNGSQTCTQ
jgi:outer membrane biogenesis lipoprotein LolB